MAGADAQLFRMRFHSLCTRDAAREPGACCARGMRAASLTAVRARARMAGASPQGHPGTGTRTREGELFPLPLLRSLAHDSDRCNARRRR